MNIQPAIRNFTPITRGDTFVQRLVAELSQDGNPIALTNGRLQVRKALSDDLVTEWNTSDDSMTITGHQITLNEKTAEAMALLAVGEHIYDLEVVVTATGQTVTLLKGTFTILPDVSK